MMKRENNIIAVIYAVSNRDSLKAIRISETGSNRKETVDGRGTCASDVFAFSYFS